MTFPNTKNKHLYDPFFSPLDYIKYMKSNNLLPDFRVPKGVLFIYSQKLRDKLIEGKEVVKIDIFKGDFYIFKDNGVGIVHVGIGAPAITTVAEELIALGTTKFFSIGTAGAIQKTLKLADIVVCNKAIRDEGVSHHYLESAKYVEPSLSLTVLLKGELEWDPQFGIPEVLDNLVKLSEVAIKLLV